MVIADWCGPEELSAQEPLAVEDGGNVWIVRGQRVRARREDPSAPGPIWMKVSKLDAAIVSFTN